MPMTRDEAVALIKLRMGNNNDSSLDALIVTEMKLAQDVLEQEASLPWFLVEEAETPVLSGVRTFTPTASGTRAFLQPFPDVHFYIYASPDTLADKTMLIPDDYRDLWNRYSTTANTFPPKYYSNELSDINTYALFPAPSKDCSVVVPAYYADAPLDTNITNKWLTYAPEVLINYTGKVISGFYLNFLEFAQGFATMEKIARTRLSHRTVVWEENFIRRMMGDS